jgi:hypothetical protein
MVYETLSLLRGDVLIREVEESARRVENSPVALIPPERTAFAPLRPRSVSDQVGSLSSSRNVCCFLFDGMS